MNVKNFKSFEPSDKIKGVLYLKSEDGKDWYASQKEFNADTIKIMYDQEGRIISTNTDITALFPIDSSVAELPKDTIIKLGDYYINGVFVGTKPSDNHIWDGSQWTQKQLTKSEKIANIKKYYDARFTTLDKALVHRRLINGDITDLQEQYNKLNIEMLAKIKAVN